MSVFFCQSWKACDTLSLKHYVRLESPLSDLVSEFDVKVSVVTKHVYFPCGMLKDMQIGPSAQDFNFRFPGTLQFNT